LGAAELVSLRSFGDVEVATIRHGRYVIGGDQPDMDICGMFVRIGDARVLIDPNSFSVPGDDIYPTVTLVPGPPIEEALALLGVTPEEITHVAITHGHGDHYTGVSRNGAARFPNAETTFPARDWQAFAVENRGGHVAHMIRHLGPPIRAGRLRLLEGDHELCPGVTLLDGPGESPGHQMARIQTPVGRVYYIGDIAHWPHELEDLERTLQAPDRNPAAAIASKRRLLDDAGADSVIVFTHGDFPAWGTLEDGRWRYL
jgi:glyoxylase-like metal-dependent hydrolase (beta-lactamase superfamily II)